MYRLENWSLGSTNDPLMTAPEMQVQCLNGNVYNHPHFDEGYSIHTSSIVEIHDGGIVETRSGSKYKLGTPDPSYIAWCKKKGCHVPTIEQPIRIIE